MCSVCMQIFKVVTRKFDLGRYVSISEDTAQPRKKRWLRASPGPMFLNSLSIHVVKRMNGPFRTRPLVSFKIIL